MCRAGQTAFVAAALLLVAGCVGPGSIEDPVAELRSADNFPNRQLAAMEALDVQPNDEAYLELLHGIIWRPGYTPDVREAALNRLAERDPEELQKTIRQRLPQMSMWAWLRRLSAIIAERGWREQTPALVSSWARPTTYVQDETSRPEYQALAVLWGEDHVIDVVFQTFVESDRVVEQGLRTRCWNLLHRLGQRDRLVALVADSEARPDDAMLIDLRAAAAELGIVPRNREEILWVRTLRTPEYVHFWEEAVAAIGSVPAARHSMLELRDLPIIVAARRHVPELLERDASQLYTELASRLSGEKHHFAGSNFDNMRGYRTERLHEYRDDLTWSDLAAMHIAIRAMQVPEMVAHLFDYVERDRADTSTEYGGVIRLDEQGRFELMEFPPQLRRHDQEFIASQAMLDAAYTAQFHFHLHVQRPRNDQYAGPGFGDFNYADNTRANCLVFTSVGEDVLNMDFYRHSRVVVDLGEVHRAAGRRDEARDGTGR